MAAKGLKDELLEVLEQCTPFSLQIDPKFMAGVEVFSALVC